MSPDGEWVGYVDSGDSLNKMATTGVLRPF
jgi:hypothetical protein